jgi:class 3 adenylate cyclase
VTSGHALAELEGLLAQILERPDAEAELSRVVDSRFGRNAAVLVLDMSGFSRTTRTRGIVAFLLMIHQMKRLAGPAIAGEGGVVVKAEADNLYCVFDTVPQALRAAEGILGRLAAANAATSEERCIYAAMGIGFGRILHIEGEDLFGDEVNLACKLGEDVAQQDQILLTQSAAAEAADAGLVSVAKEVTVSGLALPYGAYR